MGEVGWVSLTLSTAKQNACLGRFWLPFAGARAGKIALAF
jgi:hypothetical protein